MKWFTLHLGRHVWDAFTCECQESNFLIAHTVGGKVKFAQNVNPSHNLKPFLMWTRSGFLLQALMCKQPFSFFITVDTINCFLGPSDFRFGWLITPTILIAQVSMLNTKFFTGCKDLKKGLEKLRTEIAQQNHIRPQNLSHFKKKLQAENCSLSYLF